MFWTYEVRAFEHGGLHDHRIRSAKQILPHMPTGGWDEYHGLCRYLARAIDSAAMRHIG